jgi:hypothetical protein
MEGMRRLAPALLLALVLGSMGGPCPVEGAAPPPGARAFSIARLKYGGGGDWYGNATSLRNLLAAARTRHGLRLAGDDEAVVEPGAAALFQYPFVFASGHGNIRFTDAEVRNLRQWLEGGGFLWVDDDYGMAASVRRELARVLPGSPLVELPFSHPLFRSPYAFAGGAPKVHEHDGGPARVFGAFVDGRLCVLFTFDTDIGDGLEDEGVHDDTPEAREAALRFALNIVHLALTQ